MDSIVRAGSTARMRSGSLTQELLHRLDDLGSDPLFRIPVDPLLAMCVDENDLVLGRIESDALARDVVVDDKVDALRCELLARTPESPFTVVGGKADEYLAVAPIGGQRPQDVGRRLELHLPGLLALRPFRGE